LTRDGANVTKGRRSQGIEIEGWRVKMRRDGTRGLYFRKYPPPGRYQPMSSGGKNMKRRREKGGKCKRKMKKGERKMKKGERK
jgi:hypothetical protein